MLEKNDPKPFDGNYSNAVLDTLFGQALATQGIVSQ
jgi:hypothetical protein